MLKFVSLSRAFLRLTDSFTTNSHKLNNRILNNAPLLYQSIKNYSNIITAEIMGLHEDVVIQDITEGDEELEKKLRVLILETDVMRQEGSKIPDISFLRTQHWKELVNKPSRSQRKKYLEFLWKIERKKENKKTRQEENRIERESRPEYVDDGHIRYGLNNNTMFIRIYDQTINNLYNSRLVTAMQYGQPLVIDCGYDDNMTTRECLNCAKQIMLAFGENRFDDNPFDLHLCNVNVKKPIFNQLSKFIATINEPWFPLQVHHESYSNVKYPSLPYLQNKSDRTSNIPDDIRNRIVYLTPHCREELREFDHDAIYIIGGIVDKINQEPLSLAKAKREGLRMAKLPLDRYLQWGGGSGKSLTLNQMVSILLDIKNTGDWDYALRHVPRRKVLGTDTNTFKLHMNKDIDRNGPSYDRGWNKRKYYDNQNNNNDRGWNKTKYYNDDNNNNNFENKRSFDNLKGRQNKKPNTSDLIRSLMER